MTIPLLVCIIGLVLYIIASETSARAWIGEVGRIAFAFGLLATLLSVSGKPIF